MKKKEKKEKSKEALDILLAAVDKQFGKGAITTLDHQAPFIAENVIDSGSIGLNAALGVGGYPRGRMVEIWGAESSGKTTLCLHAIASEQRKGNTCAFIDTEHALDAQYAEQLGVDISKLLVSQPNCGEEALEIADMMARSGAVSLAILDSIAALVCRAELDGEMGDSHIGLQARLMSQACRKLVPTLKQSKMCLIFTNQTRANIGVMYGSNVTVTGGNALKFYASQRLNIRRTGKADQKENIGNQTKVKVVKNKVASPFREADFRIIFGKGIDPLAEILDLSEIDGLIKKSGPWYRYEDIGIGQGKENTISYLKDNPELTDKLRKQILENRGLA